MLILRRSFCHCPPTHRCPQAAPTPPPAPVCDRGAVYEWSYDCGGLVCGNNIAGTGFCLGIDYNASYDVACRTRGGAVRSIYVGAGQAPSYQDFLDVGCKLGKSSTITGPETTYICSPFMENHYTYNDHDWAQIDACIDSSTVKTAAARKRCFCSTRVSSPPL